MEYLFVHYPKCSTCKKAKAWLDQNHIAYIERDMKTENPSEAELKEWIKKSNYPVSKFFNTSGILYREWNMKEKVKTLPEEELIRILASDGMLVKRPLLIGNDRVLVGFKEEDWKSLKRNENS